MGQLGTKMRRAGRAEGYTAGGLVHWCPGCESMHQFALDGKNSSGAQWTWDGNVDAPTFSPSMLIRVNPPGHPHHQPRACSSTCHYFLRGGRIEYLGDCTHALRGQTIPLPELPDHLRDRIPVPRPTRPAEVALETTPAPPVVREEKNEGFRPGWWRKS